MALKVCLLFSGPRSPSCSTPVYVPNIICSLKEGTETLSKRSRFEKRQRVEKVSEASLSIGRQRVGAFLKR